MSALLILALNKSQPVDPWKEGDRKRVAKDLDATIIRVVQHDVVGGGVEVLSKPSDQSGNDGQYTNHSSTVSAADMNPEK